MPKLKLIATLPLLLFFILTGTPAQSTDGQSEYHNTSAKLASMNIIGLWRNPKHGFMKRIEASDIGFVLREASENHASNFIGDVEGQFQQSFSKPNVFVGRHIWGGRRTKNLRWGAERALVLNLISDTKLHVRYLDSKFSDGWTYIKQESHTSGITTAMNGYVVGVVHCSGGGDKLSTAFIVRGFGGPTRNSSKKRRAMADFINAEYVSKTFSNCSSKEVFSANGAVFSYDTKAGANKKYADLISRWKKYQNIITIGSGYNQADWE